MKQKTMTPAKCAARYSAKILERLKTDASNQSEVNSFISKVK